MFFLRTVFRPDGLLSVSPIYIGRVLGKPRKNAAASFRGRENSGRNMIALKMA